MSESDNVPLTNIEVNDVTKLFVRYINRYKTVTKPLHNRYIITVPFGTKVGRSPIVPLIETPPYPPFTLTFEPALKTTTKRKVRAMRVRTAS